MDGVTMSAARQSTPPIPAEPVEFLVQRLRRIRDDEGVVSAQMVEMVAATAGVSTRQVHRWVAQGTRQRKPRAKTALTPELKTLYFEMNGSIRRVIRQAAADGVACPPRSTLQVLFNRELSAAQRAYAKHGEHGRRKMGVYLRNEVGHRNAVWETDHKELGVYVIPPRGHKEVKPWLTSFMDAKHRLIVGVAISMSPTAADVIAAFRSAVRKDPEGISPAYGAPDEVHWDNGREFLSDAMTEVVLNLGCLPRALPAYAPHMKGKIERWHRTLDTELLAGLPHFSQGPRAANNKLYGSAESMYSYDLLCQTVLAWVTDYNYKRPHSALGGLTPAASWEADPAMIREISDRDLRWMSLPSVERTILQDGIHFANHTYIAPEIMDLRGEVVVIRYTPHDHRSVDVYRDRAFLCTATISNALTAEEQKQVLAKRRRDHHEANRFRKKASHQAKVRLASVTAASDPSDEQVTVIDRRQAAASGLSTSNLVPLKAAKPTGLNQPWTPETAVPESTDPAGERPSGTDQRNQS